MVKQVVLMAVLALWLVLAGISPALAQSRGWGDRGRSWGRDDDDRREEMRRRFGEMRSRFGSGESRGWSGWGRDRDDDDDDRGRDRGRDRGDDRERGSGESRRGDRGRDSGPKPYVPTPHQQIGAELPGDYAAGDSDGDGQIDLLEWRQWKPQDIAGFMKLDVNQDGFLTARELVVAQNRPVQTPTEPVAAYQASSATVPTSTAAPDADGNQAAPGEKPSAAEARWVFNQLDKNNNGNLEDNEWQSSKTIRATFEKQGISLTLPVDQATFLERYPPQRIVPNVPLPPR